jgi:MscS family membrane protein
VFGALLKGARMISILGHQFRLPVEMQFLANAYGSFVATVIAWGLIALLAYLILRYGLKWLVHRIPGEIDDIILGILRGPLMISLISFGIINSLRILPMTSSAADLLGRVLGTVLTLALAFFLWRLIRNVFAYYGTSWARKTESRVDDIIIPIVSMCGSLAVSFAAALIILTQWGLKVTSALAGAGIVTIVLGLALQETLSNIFSGIALLADAPFKTSDLIVLADGKICEVEKIGLRTTQLHFLDEHSTVYVPNKDLANSTIINITKPTVDLKVSIGIGISYSSDLAHAQEVLRAIAIAHPNVLVAASLIDHKLRLLARTLETTKKLLAPERDDRSSCGVQSEVGNYENAIKKHEIGKQLDDSIRELCIALARLKRDIGERESGGLTAAELTELQNKHIRAIESWVPMVMALMEKWFRISDPWAEDAEQAGELDRWCEKNRQLGLKWRNLQKALARPKQEQEMRLDDMTQTLVDWVRKDYKSIAESWKNPQVIFKGFEASSIDLQLDFYIDDIRLEHFRRKQRVIAEIASEIHRRFREEGIVIPFPQLDVRLPNLRNSAGSS